MKRGQVLAAAAVVAVVVGVAVLVPGGLASSVGDSTAATDVATDGTDQTSAPTGQQIATVIEVTDDEVRSDIETVTFETAFESASDAERAALLADRAETLRDRTDGLAATEERTTAAYRADELTTEAFARELALLNARSTTLLDAFDRLDERAEAVPDDELQAAGYDRPANEVARGQLTRLTGSGAAALLQQYTGEQAGEFTVDIDDGVSIEVENEDGERTREFERDRPGNGTLVVSQEDATDAARDILAADVEGEWLLRSAEADDGVYEFEFAFRGPTHTGEAEVSVDGETGQVFEVEEELEPREDDDETLGIAIVEGTPGPGATVTVRVTAAGEPVADAPVEVDDTVVGTTDVNGELSVMLPNDDDVDIEVEHGDRDGELEFEFDEERVERLGERLSVTGSLDDGTVTLTVTDGGSGVEGLEVSGDDGFLGTTDVNGQLTFETAATDEIELELSKDAFEAELEFEVIDGTLELVDADIDGLVDEDDSDDANEEDDADDSDDADDENDTDDSDDENDTDDEDDTDDADDEDDTDDADDEDDTDDGDDDDDDADDDDDDEEDADDEDDDDDDDDRDD